MALFSELCAGESRGALQTNLGGSTSPVSGMSTDAQLLPQCGQPGRDQRGEGKGLPEGAYNGGCVAGGCRAELSGSCGGALRASKGQNALAGASGWSIRGPAKYLALPPCVPSPARPFPRTGPANSAGGGAGRAPGCGRQSEEGGQNSRGRRRQPQGRPVATAPRPARGHQVAGGVGPPSA